MDFELDDKDEQKDQARHRGEHEPCGVRGCNSCHKRFLHFLMLCVLWVLFQRRPRRRTPDPDGFYRRSNIRFFVFGVTLSRPFSKTTLNS